MPRQYVLSSIPADAVSAANVAFAAIVGDSPGTINFTANANLTGDPLAALSHAIGNPNLAESEAAEWRVWLTENGGGAKLYPVASGVTYDFPRETWNWFALKKV